MKIYIYKDVNISMNILLELVLYIISLLYIDHVRTHWFSFSVLKRDYSNNK